MLKEIYVERQEKFLKVAIKENSLLTQCYIEEENDTPKISNIYKGIVKNIIPAIKCAFIDIGYEKNAYMYLRDDLEGLKKGQEVLVEIIKEESYKKGPKVINSVSFPGNYVVISNSHKDIRFSPKIKDESFKNQVSNNIKMPNNIGVTIRTNGYNVDINLLEEEIQNLYKIYEKILNKFTYSNQVGILYDNEGILGNVLRNLSNNEYNIFVDNEKDYNYCTEFLMSKNKEANIKFYNNNISLFDYYGIEKEILSLRNSRVNLHNGGNIVIEKTEAMYVIDVNSAKNVKGHSKRKTIFETNLEAAKTIANQIRLRNLSGIIIVDFIDMVDFKERQEVISTLRKGFSEDKNKTTVYDFSELSLVQIARRHSGKSIYEYIFENCSCCHGRGVKIRLNYIENMIKNKITRLLEDQSIKDIYIEIDEIYKKQIQLDMISFIKNINALDKNVYINYIENFEGVKIEPLLFTNQIRNLSAYKAYTIEK